MRWFKIIKRVIAIRFYKELLRDEITRNDNPLAIRFFRFKVYQLENKDI